MSTRDTAGRRPDILEALRSADAPLTINDLAEQLGVHPNTVRFHLDRLIPEGWVERAEAPADVRASGRPAQYFRAVRRMDPGGPRHYELLAEALVSALGTGADAERRALEIGREWGHATVATDAPAPERGAASDRSEADTIDADPREPGVRRLVALLHEQGCEPEPTDHDGDATIGLHHCPFLELAERHTGTVCAVHLGMMQGATADASVTVDRIEPFAEPDRCVAHLAPQRR